MKKLFKFHADCGRMGELDGLFLAYQAEVDNAIGKTVSFGEVLGKHSDISVNIECGLIDLISDDPHTISTLSELFPNDNICGHNPLDYI